MKLLTKIIIGLFGILLILSITSYTAYGAEPQQKYNRLRLDPLYREQLIDGQDYNYTLTVEAPDGFSNIQSAIVTFQVWHNPSIRYYLWVNGQTCNTQSFYVSTTYANAGEGTIYFDCSDEITKEGTYTITLQTNDDTGTVTAWADITYINKPKGTVEVHGTEYEPGQRAKIWLQLLNETGDEINDAACRLHLFDPTGGSYVEDTSMINMEHDGIYYYDLVAPQAQGVYPAVAECYFQVTTERANVTASQIGTGLLDAGTVALTRVLDGDEYKLREVGNYLNVNFTFGNMCGTNVAEDLLTSVSIIVNVKRTEPEANDNLVINWYNWSSGKWVELPNRIITPNDRVTVTNTIITNNVTRDGLVSGGVFKLKINDTYHGAGRQDGKTEFDLVVADCEQLENPEWQTVRGSSEMHITSDDYWTMSVIQGNITNETLTGYFYLDLLLSSQTAQMEEDQNVYFDMFAPFPCHHILNVTVDDVGVDWYSDNPSTEFRGCRVAWLQDLDKGINYDVQIKAEKWFAQEENNWVAEARVEYDILRLACNNYRIGNNLDNYSVPLDYDVKRHNDTFYAMCNQYLDFFYHFNKSYFEEYETVSVVLAPEDMTGLDNFYFHMRELSKQLDSLASDLMEALTTGGAYSIAVLANPTGQPVPHYATYWANISSNYLLYLQGLALPTNTWSYYNRTLTENVTLTNASLGNIWSYSNRSLSNFEFDVVNEQEVAENVWNWTGFVNSNLLSYFNRTIDIWSYVTRTLTGFGFDVIDEVEVSDNVWNNTARYTHGEVLS